jgi:signal transduction histidine kinase
MKPHPNQARDSQKGATLFRTLVVSFSLIAGFSCILIGTLTYYQRAKGIRSVHFKLLETLRDEKIASLTAWFTERMGDTRVMVTRPDVVSFCRAHGKNDAAARALTLAALTTMRTAYRYEAVFLTDREGNPIASTEKIPHTRGSLPKREATLARAIREKRTVVSDVLISKVHQRPTLFIFAPVFEPRTHKLIGVLGLLMNPSVWLYPRFASSQYLGESGEMLLVNQEGLVQTPLKFRKGAISSLIIHATPAERGARGESGIIAIEDYRNQRVMAAYGHIKEFKWGIVVKQDMAEINAPVRDMAVGVTAVSAGVLMIALFAGFLIARRISQPALRIAEIASTIGAGEVDIRVPEQGPSEIRRIATNLNSMVERLGAHAKVTKEISRLLSIAGKHRNLSELLEESLAALMDATRSQLGVVFLVDPSGERLDRMLVHGHVAETFPRQLTLKPPDHLLAKALAAACPEVLAEIPAGHDMTIDTHAGETAPRALLSIPLLLRGAPMGVIGLASLYDYEETAERIADGVSTSLAQAVELCHSFEQSEEMSDELNARNLELTATNEEIQAKSEEMQQQAEEMRSLAEELEAQREQVTQADRLKSEFLSNMSHELRTPLNSVLSLSQLMLSNGIGAAGGEDRERVEIIERNGRHLLRLINDILDLSKIEAGKMDLFVTSFEVSEPLHAAVGAVRPLADEKGLAFKLEGVGTGTMDTMESDLGKIQQILLNLLSNAHKFTEMGEIGIEIRPDGDAVSF